MESANTTKEAFCIEGGRKSFYQWDVDQKIIVNDPDIDEVHFCNGTSDKALVSVVKDGTASVPNILLQTAGKVKVYGYSVDHTRVEKIYEVKARTKPEDYVYEETEVYRWAELDKRLLTVENSVEMREWELIAERTMDGRTASFNVVHDSGQRAFKLSKAMVTLEYTGDIEHKISLSCEMRENDSNTGIIIAKVHETYSADKKHGTIEVYPHNGYWNTVFYGAMDENGMCPVKGMPLEYHMKNRIADVPYINAFFVERDSKTNNNPLPMGTVIKIWGVRAKE